MRGVISRQSRLGIRPTPGQEEASMLPLRVGRTQELVRTVLIWSAPFPACSAENLPLCALRSTRADRFARF
jgi:hypothetical protein